MPQTQASNYVGSVAALTTSYAVVAPQKTSRRKLMLFNAGANPARISFESNGLAYYEIAPNTGIQISENPPLNAVYAASSTGTTNLNVIDG